MKKILKFAILLLAIAMLASSLCLLVFAEEQTEEPTEPEREFYLPEEDAELVEGATFEVIAANGKRRSSGILDVEFEAALEGYYDGDTVILLNDIHIVPRDAEGNEVADTTYREDPSVPYTWAQPQISSDIGATVSLDLNGYGIIFRDDDWMGDGRQTQGVMGCKGNAVFNLYSSKPGGYIFASSTKTSTAGYYTGGFIMGINDSPTVTIGKFTKPDGTVVPGSNLSTSAPGFLNFNNTDATVYVDGGTYYRYRTGSQVGLIAHREGSEAYLEIKNANLICYGMGGSYMIRGMKSETVLENCVIFNVSSSTANMVSNQGGGVGSREYYRFTGKLTLRDCATNYNLSSVSLWPENAEGYIGQLFLEGETAFRKDAADNLLSSFNTYKDGFTQVDGGYEQVYKGVFEEGTVLARTSRGLSVAGNPALYIPGYGDSGATSLPEGADYYEFIAGRMGLQTMEMNPYFEGYTFVAEEDTVNCRFVDASNVSFDYTYKKGVEIAPLASIAFPKDTIDGVFKYGWKFTQIDEKNCRMEVKPFADFDLRVSFDLSSGLALNVYIPKAVFNVYVDPVGCAINGMPIIAGTGTEVTLDVDGTGVVYYRFKVEGLSALQLVNGISVDLPLNFWSDDHGRRIQGEGSWTVDVLSYFDKACAEGSGITDSERQMMNDLLYYVKCIYENSFADDAEPDALTLAAIAERIDADSLSVNADALQSAIAGVGADTLDASSFGAARLDKNLGRITMELSPGFTGTVKIYLNGKLNKYAVENGKVGSLTEIILDIPAIDLFSEVVFKVLDSEGNLILGKDGTEISGRVYMASAENAENDTALAYYALAYSVGLAYSE